MGIITIILIAIIVILSFYLILLKKEIKRITNKLKNIENENSNMLLNKEFDDKDMNKLIFEINTLLKSVYEKEAKIHTKSSELQKMITNVAHDLRTPLTSALGYIDMVKNSNLTEEEKEKYISIIEERLKKLSYFITSFFEFSKVISKEESIDLKKENIIGVLEECIASFYEDFANNNRKIELNTNLNKIEVMTNKQLLTRIFDNLIINAYKHSKSDLIINLEKNEKETIIIFENELEDMNIDTDEIFNEFYTVDMSRTKGNTGLGLAIAKEFVSLLKGRIYAEKEEDLLRIIIKIRS